VLLDLQEIQDLLEPSEVKGQLETVEILDLQEVKGQLVLLEM
jgi:hypothetical protein